MARNCPMENQPWNGHKDPTKSMATTTDQPPLSSSSQGPPTPLSSQQQQPAPFERDDMKDKRELRGYICFRCGREGHVANECKERDEGGPGFRGVICFKCGEAGHLANKCDKRGRGCFYCGKDGHIAVECTEKFLPRRHSGFNSAQDEPSLKYRKTTMGPWDSNVSQPTPMWDGKDRGDSADQRARKIPQEKDSRFDSTTPPPSFTDPSASTAQPYRSDPRDPRIDPRGASLYDPRQDPRDQKMDYRGGGGGAAAAGGAGPDPYRRPPPGDFRNEPPRSSSDIRDVRIDRGPAPPDMRDSNRFAPIQQSVYRSRSSYPTDRSTPMDAQQQQQFSPPATAG
jgi:hypothetical protein